MATVSQHELLVSAAVGAAVAAGATRQVAAAITSAAIRSVMEPWPHHQVDREGQDVEELKGRLQAVAPVLAKQVANEPVPGSMKVKRNLASHANFGEGAEFLEQPTKVLKKLQRAGAGASNQKKYDQQERNLTSNAQELENQLGLSKIEELVENMAKLRLEVEASCKLCRKAQTQFENNFGDLEGKIEVLATKAVIKVVGDQYQLQDVKLEDQSQQQNRLAAQMEEVKKSMGDFDGKLGAVKKDQIKHQGAFVKHRDWVKKNIAHISDFLTNGVGKLQDDVLKMQMDYG